MENYTVILTSCVNMIRDVDMDIPETKDYYYFIMAKSEEEALALAKEKHPVSVWESEVYKTI